MSRPVFVSSTAFTPRPLKNPVSLQSSPPLTVVGSLMSSAWRHIPDSTGSKHIVFGPRQAELSLCSVQIIELRPGTTTEPFPRAA